MSYRIAHVTTEMLGFTVGGLGVVVNHLYENRNDDEHFIIVGRDVKAKDVMSIGSQRFSNSYKEIFDGYETVFIHSPNLFSHMVYPHPNVVYVIHGNNIIEATYDRPSPLQESVYHFKRGIEFSRSVVVVSNNEKRILSNMMAVGAVKTRPIDVAYNGISYTRRPIEVKRNGLIGYIGRTTTRKGIFTLLSEMRQVNDYRLLLAMASKGNLPAKRIVAEQIKAAGGFGRITPVGYVKGERKESFYRSVEAVVVPSIYEPFGMIVIEAMAHGTPAIASMTSEAFIEILGADYPLYFNPMIEGDFKRVLAVFSGMTDEERRRLVEGNYERLKIFSVENMQASYRSIK